MQDFANLAVVLLVVAASFTLLFMLLLRSPQEQETTKFVTQALALWTFAWVAWAMLWGIKALLPAEDLSPADLVNPRRLLTRLQATNPPISMNLWSKMGKLSFTNAPSDDQLKIDLSRRLNVLIRSGPLFQADLINPTILSPRVLGKLGTILNGNALITFNRQLLSEIYRGDINEKRTNSSSWGERWPQNVGLGLSSVNAIFLLLIIVVVQNQKRVPLSLLMMYGLTIVVVIAAYYLSMFGLSRLDSSNGNETFDDLLVHWSIAESVLAPLLLTVTIWKLSGSILPLVCGILYALAQPVVYQADVENSSGFSSQSKEAILVTLAFLKIFLAASVLYAIGRYASVHFKAFPSFPIKIRGKTIVLSTWNVTVASLIVCGAFAWYVMAGKSYPGVIKGVGVLIAIGTTALKWLQPSEGSG